MPLPTNSPLTDGRVSQLACVNRTGCSRLALWLSIALCGLPTVGAADSVQGASPRSFTVQEAINYALENYPALQASVERYVEARGGVGLAKTNYLPSLQMLYQDNRATRNNVAGVLLPQSVIPNPSGTVLAPSPNSFWGSGGGVLLSYDVLDFGYRHAELRAAQSTERRAQEDVALSRLDVAAAVADASLLVLAANQQLQASQADVDRRAVFAMSVHALVDARLRPGADASRVDAELAAARDQLVLARETQQVSAGAFAEVLGLAGARVAVAPGPFLRAPSEERWGAPEASSHPAAVAGRGRIEEAQAQLGIVDHSYYPHVAIQAIAAARGSGANAQGAPLGGNAGLWPNAATNWGAGITITFQPLSPVVAAQKRGIERAHEREQQALYDQTLQSIKAQTGEAQAVLEAARAIAANAPQELQASQASEAQAVARFNAGLGTIVDVAEAQRLLLLAQIDDSLATLNVWRALARLAAAQGNLEPFIELANRSEVRGR